MISRILHSLVIYYRLKIRRMKVKQKGIKLYRERRSDRVCSVACFMTSTTSSSSLSINCATSADVTVPGHVLQDQSLFGFRGSFGNISPFLQGQFRVPKCVPSSVGSEQRLHRQAKYFVARRCSLLILVDQSACVYMVLKCSPLEISQNG